MPLGLPNPSGPVMTGANFAESDGMDIAYFILNAALCMFLVPCPGVPGNMLTLYLKSPVSKAMMAISVACSAAEWTPYL